MGGNVRRRHAGKNNRPKTSNRHEVDNQIQSEGDNSIQGEDVKLEKSRKNRRSPSPRQPTKQRCGNCCVAMAVLLLVLASSAVYVYNYVDTAPLIAPVRIQTAIWLDILQRDLALVWSNFFNETPPPTDREPGKEDTKDVREERGAPSEDKGSGEEGGGSGAVRDGKRTERAAEQDEAEEIPKNDEETLEKAEREVVGVEGAADAASVSDQGRRSAASDDEDPSLDEREADTPGTVSPDAEDIELQTVPSSDSIEKTERETVPSSDSIENIETETVPISDTIENVETETVPPSDTIENTEKETMPSSNTIENTKKETGPSSDTIENTEQETVSSSNSIEKTEQEAQSSSDNIEHMKNEEESPIDDIEQSEEDGEPPNDNTEHLEEDGEPPSDNIEQLEEDGEPPSDNIEQLEDEGEPPSDDIEHSEDEGEPPSDDTDHSEDEGDPPSDDIEQMEEDGEPPSDDIEQSEEDGEPPSDDIEHLEEDGEPPSDDIEHSEAETEPPSNDIEHFEEEEEPPSDNIEQTEQEAGPLSNKDEHSSDIAGEKESVLTKSQEQNGEDAELGPHDQHAESHADKFVNQENEDAVDVMAKSREETSKPGSTPGRYKNAHITNQADFEIREKLDAGDKLLEQKQLKDGRAIFEQLLSLHPQSPRATYGRALALDLEADMYRSNALLEQAITEYLRVLDLPDVPKALIIQTGHKCASRQTFRGWVHRAVRTLQKVVTLFPEELDLWSKLGVEYLIQGSNERAREAFLHVLQHRPDDGFAKVHLGFIIKVADRNYNESIPFLQQGIDSGVPGTIDGRFFLHLGDALYRVGRHEEAQKVYELGYKKGVFMSPWQRSLHNVERLAAHPWWTAKETGVEGQLKMLAENWKVIRDEGLAQLNDTTGAFELESEDLRDKGEWRQFTLYKQGHKVPENCRRTPKTCALLDKFAEATSCKRGQIKYSVMHPGIHVWPHCGPTNCRIRAHLGLVVPPGLTIRVVNETRSWKEGEFIVFDDSFDHEVWHDGNSLRLVLIVDIWHPELSARERTILPPI